MPRKPLVPPVPQPPNPDALVFGTPPFSPEWAKKPEPIRKPQFETSSPGEAFSRMPLREVDLPRITPGWATESGRYNPRGVPELPEPSLAPIKKKEPPRVDLSTVLQSSGGGSGRAMENFIRLALEYHGREILSALQSTKEKRSSSGKDKEGAETWGSRVGREIRSLLEDDSPEAKNVVLELLDLFREVNARYNVPAFQRILEHFAIYEKVMRKK